MLFRSVSTDRLPVCPESSGQLLQTSPCTWRHNLQAPSFCIEGFFIGRQLDLYFPRAWMARKVFWHSGNVWSERRIPRKPIFMRFMEKQMQRNHLNWKQFSSVWSSGVRRTQGFDVDKCASRHREQDSRRLKEQIIIDLHAAVLGGCLKFLPCSPSGRTILFPHLLGQLHNSNSMRAL